MNLIGDVRGKVAVMMDDMIDTAGKLSHLSYSNKILKLSISYRGS
jgi:phosphoribosylpyrophosphate synthetase